MIVRDQYENPELASWYNVGPDDCDCVTTGDIVDMFCNAWGNGLTWINKHDGGPHEANFLKLDSSKLKTTFGWKPTWHMDETIRRIVEWTRVYEAGGDIPAIMDKQIRDFLDNTNN